MSRHNLFINNLKRGFTMVEMLIVAPIIILIIGVFITAIVSMTGDVLSNKSANVLAFNIQDALNRIEQDVKSSGGFLSTNNIPITPPQGYNNDSTYFHNANSDTSIGSVLILNSYSIDKNPSDPSRKIIYADNGPSACSSADVNQNSTIMLNIIYFVKNNSLWRRVIAPSNYSTDGCSSPWQRPSCALGYSTTSFCKVQDTQLIDGILASGFSVNYYPTSSSTLANTVANDGSQTDSVRLAALRTNSTVGVTVSATSSIAGRDIIQTGSIRVVSPNNNISTVKAPYFSKSGGGAWTKKAPITIVNFQPNFQTSLDITYDSDMKADFSDLRFYDETAMVELPYWIESKTDSTTAKVWVRSALNNNISLYYGNSSAINSSNADTTFIDFEDWSDFTADYNRYRTGDTVVNNGYGFQNTNTVGQAACEVGVAVTTQRNSNSKLPYGYTGCWDWGGGIGTAQIYKTVNYGIPIKAAVSARSYHTDHEAKFLVGSQSVTIPNDNSDHQMTITHSTTVSNETLKMQTTKLNGESESMSDTLWYWYAVRSYNSTEPTFTLGTETSI